MEPGEARLELARRFLHVLGPGTALSFSRWAGVGRGAASVVFRALQGELAAVRTPVGEAWILAADEDGFRGARRAAKGVRLLPSGDAYFLAWGSDREILVPDSGRRAELWTTRVWPGALLVNGEIAGVWRRAGAKVSIQAWRQLTAREREAVEAEAMGLPLAGPLTVMWEER